ncbi:putative lysine-rich arabinogalactan protein 19 [Iris pallida]|uniref:Lysine-rich arabinogalactan protein 19 n=1 Tax=Iris pallida TaxID=29817 RepID=A0AAX6GPM5_IRIPA|nr:putative lysine-rich arabinogalactan protein 19 [Iris pallida]
MANVDQHHLHLLLSSSPLCESPPSSNNRRHHVHPRHPTRPRPPPPHGSPPPPPSQPHPLAAVCRRANRECTAAAAAVSQAARARWQHCRTAAGDEATLADLPLAGRTPGAGPVAVAPLSDAYRRRSVRLARVSVVTSSKTKLKRHPVAATSCIIFEKSDRWIGDFFAPSQSRFAGPISSACISSTAASFGMLPVPVRSWTLWLRWDLPYTYQLFRLSRRITWRCLLA